ncbi:hypothetical protein Tco_1158830, partial [Tanacetum coccineum]
YNSSITTGVGSSFGSLYDEFFNDATSRVNKSSSPTDNSIPKDTLPLTNTQPTSKPTTPTNVHAEENNDNQAEFTNPFCTSVQENVESSSHNIGDKLVSWMSKKQDCTTMSSVEAEYVASSESCAQFVRTEYQLADMFTKALLEDRFQYLVRRIGMRCLTPAELEVLTNESA